MLFVVVCLLFLLIRRRLCCCSVNLCLSLSLLLVLCRACVLGRLAPLYFWNDARPTKDSSHLLFCSLRLSLSLFSCFVLLCVRNSWFQSPSSLSFCLSSFVVPFPSWYEQNNTVHFVSRDPSFCCRRSLTEINTSLESAWSTKLKSIAFGLNRGIFDELD